MPDKPKCAICGNELTHEDIARLTSMDFSLCCKAHSEYSTYFQTGIAKALAGYGDGTYTDEQIEVIRNNMREGNTKAKEDFVDWYTLGQKTARQVWEYFENNHIPRKPVETQQA
jgi:hypothetical protein